MSRISRMRRARRYRPSMPQTVVARFKSPPRPLVEINRGLAWYVIWTAPRAEPRIEEALRKKGLETYVPRETLSIVRRNKEIEVERPALGRYVFVGLHGAMPQWGDVHLALQGQGSWFGAPVLGRVLRCADGRPLRVPAGALQRLADWLGPVAEGNDTRGPCFAAGDAVRPVSGPLAGYVGVVHSSDDDRVKAVLSILGRFTVVEFDYQQLEAA